MWLRLRWNAFAAVLTRLIAGVVAASCLLLQLRPRCPNFVIATTSLHLLYPNARQLPTTAGLFDMLSDGNREVRQHAYSALGGFLDHIVHATPMVSGACAHGW